MEILKRLIKKKYDLIIMLEILEHLDNWENFLLKIIASNLNKGGKLVYQL